MVAREAVERGDHRVELADDVELALRPAGRGSDLRFPRRSWSRRPPPKSADRLAVAVELLLGPPAEEPRGGTITEVELAALLLEGADDEVVILRVELRPERLDDRGREVRRGLVVGEHRVVVHLILPFRSRPCRRPDHRPVAHGCSAATEVLPRARHCSSTLISFVRLAPAAPARSRARAGSGPSPGESSCPAAVELLGGGGVVPGAPCRRGRACRGPRPFSAASRPSSLIGSRRLEGVVVLAQLGIRCACRKWSLC